MPLIASIIEQGNDERWFKVQNVEIISSIISRGIVAYIHSDYNNLHQRDAMQTMLDGIEELINNVLKATQTINITLPSLDNPEQNEKKTTN